MNFASVPSTFFRGKPHSVRLIKSFFLIVQELRNKILLTSKPFFIHFFNQLE